MVMEHEEGNEKNPFEDFLKNLDAEPQQVQLTEAEMDEATKRYPGLPIPLALARYMLDRQMLGLGLGPMTPGQLWGGIHLETVGMLVQKLADMMYHQRLESITVHIACENFPLDYDHIRVELVDVGSGEAKKAQQFELDGWPCCSCAKPIPEDDREAIAAVLKKKAAWDFPAVNGENGHRAIAVLCGECRRAEKLPTHAVKMEGKCFELVPISKLEDADD